jgi:hypothetical protein
MATKIVTKNSSTASAVPTASDLVQGELAVNVADKRLFTEDNGGNIVELGTNPTTLIVDTTTLVVDSTNNRVGVGIASPTELLHVTAATDPKILVKATGAGDADADIVLDANDEGESGVLFHNAGTQKARLDWSNQNSQLNLATESGTDGTIDFQPNDTLAMRILADGKVGIGTGAPSYALSVKGLGSSTVPASFESSGSSSWLMLKDSGTTLGNVRVGSSANALVQYAGGAERMRIDSSGNVGIGTSSPSSLLTISGAESAMIQLQESGTNRGAIGIKSNEIFIADAVGGLRMSGSGTNNVIPCTSAGVGTDDVTDLGASSNQFDDIYYSGAINGSDRNIKQDIEELSEAELRVATACKGLIRKYRFIKRVEEKGDNARIHVGIIAQDLRDAFTAEGLDAGRYSMFVSNTWWETNEEVAAVEAVDAVYETQTDEEGNETQVLISGAVEGQESYIDRIIYDTAEEAPEGATEVTKLAVRYTELLAFIIAAL